MSNTTVSGFFSNTGRQDFEWAVLPRHRALQLFAACPFLFVAMLASLMSFVSLHAQANFAGITGTITERSGALVSNCQVTVRNQATSATRGATTNSNGLRNCFDLHARYLRGGALRVKVANKMRFARSSSRSSASSVPKSMNDCA